MTSARRLHPAVAGRFHMEVSPHAGALREHNRERKDWFYRDAAEDVRRKFEREMFGRLTACAHPWASLPLLQIIHDFYWSVVVIDDHLGGAGFQADAARTRSAVDRYAEVLAHPDSRETAAAPGDHAARLLQTWWHALAPRTEAWWRERFVGHLTEWLDACCWEASQLEHGRRNTDTELSEHRVHLFGSLSYMDLLHLDLPLPIPVRVFDSSLYQSYLRTAVECLCHFNDLISHAVEESADAAHANLISVLESQYGCGPDVAARHVGGLFELHVERLVALEPQLRAAFPAHVEALQEVFTRVGFWQAGFLTWHEESGRYGEPN